ncbi:MAG: zinc metalloprotease HtpX [Planctomycetes bacterium]|jgi:heat shock protein HtpX|nr:zinc metalloprotease HtpX [Planctomycetota bacterium]
MSGFWNDTKTALLMAGMMGLCLGAGYLLGGQGALIWALILGGGLNVLAYYFSDKIALASMRAVSITPQDDPWLYSTVARLAEQANMPMPRVYISPAAAPNAFATGRNPQNSAVCVTAGLRQMLNQSEMEGVIAHELSHIRHRDILISTIAAVLAGAISYLGYMVMWFGGGRRRDNPLAALLLIILAPVAAMLIRLAISRSREYEADRGGAELAGSAEGLSNALRKLDAASRQIPLPVSDAQSHLFIVAPLAGGNLSRLFATHPPVEDRIRRLAAVFA